MKLGNKTIVLITFIIILSLSFYLWNKNKQDKIEAENLAKLIYIVKTGDIKTEVKVTANAKLANEQNLSFGQEGKITNVYVKVGDEVKSGEVLAELNMDDYKNNIESAQLELENAKLSLSKLINNDTSLRESQINSQINEYKANYNIEIEQEKVLEKQLENNLAQKKDQLEQLDRDYKIAEKNLKLSKSSLDVSSKIETEQTHISITARKQTVTDIISSLNSTLGDIKYIVESVDKIYGVSKEFEKNNDNYDNYLGAKNSELKSKVIQNIVDSNKLIKDYRNNIDKINPELPDNEIYSIIQNYYNDTKILLLMCDNALDSINMSVESIGNLSTSDINSFRATVNGSRVSTINLRNQLERYSSSINGLLSNSSQEDKLKLSIDQKEINFEMQGSTLKKQEENLLFLIQEIQNIEKDSINQLNRKKAQNNSTLERIEVSKKELTNLLDGANEDDIKQLKNIIKQAELRIAKIKDSKEKYQIIAEFNGRVCSADIVEGEQYKLIDKKYIVIENPNLIELELQVSQIDIVKIKKGDPVIVTFDAYPHNPIKATVSNRSINPESNGRGGFYYKTTILLDKQELEILAGMSAIVNILTSEVKNILLIPSLSIIQEGNKKMVYKKNGDKYVLQEIKTGIVNNFQAEVISGLVEGDKIRGSVLDEQILVDMGIDESSDGPFKKK